MSVEDKRLAIIAHLRRLGNGEVQPKNYSRGLCSELSSLFEYRISQELELHFKTWPEFSGISLVPVPHPDGPMVGYEVCENKWIGDYGDSRKRLCLHVANEMEAATKSNWGVGNV